jgi:type VI protein secretion system component Hcp
MPDQSAYDIAMKFVLKGGGIINGESAMQILDGDPLMDGFTSISEYYSNFFEVTSFDFSMNLEPQDAASNAPRSAATPVGRPQPPTVAAAGKTAAAAGGDPFGRWRSATESEAQKMRFNLKFQTFHFTRVIDAASPIFFQNCCNQKRFESAALVKRVSMGIPAPSSSGSVAPAFMRLDFKDILLTSIQWDDGDLVTESCEFECNWMSFQYRQQAPDGTLLPPQTKAIWDRFEDNVRVAAGL